jgi:tyrosine-protein kinase Etk/Wzc
MEYILALLRWKKAILLFVLAATVLSAGVSLLLPVWYKSAVTVLPPRTQNLLGGLSPFASLLKDFAPTGAASRLGGGSGAVNYLAILKSRRASEAMVRRFDLMRVYGRDDNSMEKTIKEFEDNLNIEISDDGAIKLEVYDRDSLRAASMANALVETLNEIAIEMGTGEARNNRQFLEQRVAETHRELATAEDSLKKFQELRGVLVFSEDAKGTAQAIGEIYARKVQAEIELAILRRTTDESNPRIKQLSLEKSEVERALSAYPALGLTSLRLLRDVIIQQKILEFMVPMYEQARLEEHKDIPVVVVLDRAVPAEKKSRPKRMLIVAASCLSALILAVMATFVLVRFEFFRVQHADRYAMLTRAFGRKSRD